MGTRPGPECTIEGQGSAGTTHTSPPSPPSPAQRCGEVTREDHPVGLIARTALCLPHFPRLGMQSYIIVHPSPRVLVASGGLVAAAYQNSTKKSAEGSPPLRPYGQPRYDATTPRREVPLPGLSTFLLSPCTLSSGPLSADSPLERRRSPASGYQPLGLQLYLLLHAPVDRPVFLAPSRSLACSTNTGSSGIHAAPGSTSLLRRSLRTEIHPAAHPATAPPALRRNSGPSDWLRG
ncbi:hypothetical protein VTJ04DRAFT_834 [Mycothermus thermophilus]|uniref:uncharacterized protein n=1 Tax=Humicola insolens TaxID=85995 RepID=UPI003744A6F5